MILRFEGEQPGFVLVGRSLREVERRVDQMGQITMLALLVTLAASLAAVAFGEFFLRGRKSA